MTETNVVPLIDALALALHEREESRASWKSERAAFAAGILRAIEAMYPPDVVEMIQFEAQQRLADARRYAAENT